MRSPSRFISFFCYFLLFLSFCLLLLLIFVDGYPMRPKEELEIHSHFGNSPTMLIGHKEIFCWNHGDDACGLKGEKGKEKKSEDDERSEIKRGERRKSEKCNKDQKGRSCSYLDRHHAVGLALYLALAPSHARDHRSLVPCYLFYLLSSGADRLLQIHSFHPCVYRCLFCYPLLFLLCFCWLQTKMMRKMVTVRKATKRRERKYWWDFLERHCEMKR